jgi:hypothetical protein
MGFVSDKPANIKNCVVSSIINIIDKLKQYFSTKNTNFELDSNDLEFAYIVLTSTNKSLSFQKYFPMSIYGNDIITTYGAEYYKQYTQLKYNYSDQLVLEFFNKKGYLLPSLNNDIYYFMSIKLCKFFNIINKELLSENISRIFFFSKLFDSEIEKEQKKPVEEKISDKEDLAQFIKQFNEEFEDKKEKKDTESESEEESGSEGEEESGSEGSESEESESEEESIPDKLK